MAIVAVMIWLVTAWWLGDLLIAKLKLHWPPLATLTGAAAIGLSGLTLITFYLSWLFGFNQGVILAITDLGLIVCFKAKKPKLKFKPSPWLTLNLSFWALWLGLIFSQMLKVEPDGLYAGWINVWGDWAAHLSYMTSFALGSNFPPQMPLLAHTAFAYPFLSDFLPAIWVKLGLNLTTAMLFSGWLMSLILVNGLIVLGQSVGGKLKTGLLTAWLFLFGGGLGWWWWLKSFSLSHEYTHWPEKNLQWINLITSQVVPQRGFVMGFGLSLIIYWLLWRQTKKINHRELWLVGGLIMLLPLIQAHALAVTIAMTAGLTLFYFRKARPKTWLYLWLIIFLGVLPQWSYFYHQSGRLIQFIRWQPGWMSYQTNDSWWWFWLKNLGTMWPLILIGLYWLKPQKRRLTLPFWGLFLLTNLFVFQPWEWDNTKLITHWFLVASLLASMAVVKVFDNKNRLAKIIVGLLLFTSVWSGWLDNLRLSNYSDQKIRLATTEELNLADWAVKQTSSDSLWLTATNHNHWLPTLAGRKVVIGFPGWLWTYGLDYQAQEKTAAAIWAGGPLADALIKQWGIDYLVIGPAEKDTIPKLNQAWFETHYPLAYQADQTRIYRLAF